jgi:plastocyanin
MVNKTHVAISVIALFVIIGVASAYFLFVVSSKTSASSDSNMNMGNDSNTINSSVSGNEVTITIQNGTFNPVNLTVKAGTNVIWINKDSTIEPMVTGNGFMSPSLTNGQSFSYIFNQAGSYPYYDMNHPYNKTLTGNIIVQ